ncbi:hypothetical protein [Flavobacterium acetivorans]|uniref:hypothetical protein n=1 Tax=Flavobacterium acetivorans TaxID=2893883 RepID=UPI001E3DA8E2|nr:hypothetical protein [Flavobacterium sp. F-29]UFH35355.1 hypothetical protein LNP19_14865 [Flavobacterium sp. F-29]
MNRILFFILLLGLSVKGYSQSEFNSKFKGIPPIDTKFKSKKVKPPVVEPPKVIAPEVAKKPNPSPIIEKPSTISMIPKNEFINPGDAIRDKLNKKEEQPEGIVYRRNQNLGDFKTTSVTAKVLYRDAAYVDGDQIRVYLNDSVIQYQVNLDSNFQGFEIPLVKGFNKIDFEALNQGSSGPNTAEFKVYDDKGVLISASQWNLATGFKATLVLTKE